MAFKTNSDEDARFQRDGYTTGGSTTSRIEGRDRTQEELLDLAASLPYPNSNLFRNGLKARLKELRKRYHNDNWHRHMSQTKFERKEQVDETVQNIPPGD